MRFLLFFIFSSCLGFANVSPERAFKMLMDGNKRFVTESQLHANQSAERRMGLVTQEPFAVIIACSDSRVAPEIIFDQGIGDLFLVRVAGNVVGPLEQESVDYGVHHLHSPLILVMGHENCGAINAVLKGQAEDIPAIATLIKPAIERAKQDPGDKLVNAIKINIRLVADNLRQNPTYANLIKKNKLAIKEGYYNFQTGSVEILDR